MKIEEFASERPLLDPVSFFTGKTESSGVMENRGGAPIERVTTRTSGRWQDHELVLEQDLTLGQKQQHRSWRIRRLDAHHFQATANDMVGSASGKRMATFSIGLLPSSCHRVTRSRTSV